MKIVVAGGAGFVGSHLCRSLLDDGHSVVCYDNLSTGRRSNVVDLEELPGFTFTRLDVTGRSAVRDVPDADVIVHLASPASPVDYDRLPLQTLAANSEGTWNLLDMAYLTGARFVFASTSEVYGDPDEHPQPETYNGNVNPTGPRSMYDEGKRFGEALVTAMRHERGIHASIVRIFNTYGPAMRVDDGRAIPTFIVAALAGAPLPVHGDGLQTRSFMYVDDLVRGLRRVIEDPASDGLVANVGNPDEVSVWDLANVVIETIGSESGVVCVASRDEDPQRRCPDITVMRSRYGWEPRTSLDEGLRLTIDWMRHFEQP